MTGLLLIGGAATPVVAQAKDNPTKLAEKLVKQVTVGGANRHLIALQRIADQNGGTRAVDDGTLGATSAGHQASVKYVYDRLKSLGFDVSRQDFTYEDEKILAAAVTV